MTNSNPLVQAIVRHRNPMHPIATNVQPRLAKLSGIRAVMFDVYGTLIISGSGDVGSATEFDAGEALDAAFQTLEIRPMLHPQEIVARLQQTIRTANQRRTSRSCPKPEIEILDIWRQTLLATGHQAVANCPKTIVQLASEYEARANPTWPMPGASELIVSLQQRGIRLGIVSNAQVFTPRLVEDLIGSPLAEGGFDLDLCLFSNRFLRAKPDPILFQNLVDHLAWSRFGIAPEETIFVGNDKLNDIHAASVAGVRTAWFAGDARSCRSRDEDPICCQIQPDLVLTNLMQLIDCL